MPEEMNSVHIRGKLVDALRLDLVGPSDVLGDAKEVLPQSPSRWYLTGFLVPLDAAPEDKRDETANDEVDQAGEAAGTDDDKIGRASCRERVKKAVDAGIGKRKLTQK